MFGRPLWGIYKHHSWKAARKFALYKLFKGPFTITDMQHVFAAVAARICLDPSRDTKESIDFATKAVDSHLRILMETNIQDGIYTTITPSEPLISEAVCETLIGDGLFDTWVVCISYLNKGPGTLCSTLIRSGPG